MQINLKLDITQVQEIRDGYAKYVNSLVVNIDNQVRLQVEAKKKKDAENEGTKQIPSDSGNNVSGS